MAIAIEKPSCKADCKSPNFLILNTSSMFFAFFYKQSYNKQHVVDNNICLPSKFYTLIHHFNFAISNMMTLFLMK
jgi:hypothetical protein